MPDKAMQSNTAPRSVGGVVEVQDTELLRRVAASNRDSMRALEMLFDRHSAALLRFLARVLRNEQSAEDLLHDVFVRVTEAAPTFRGESTVRTWLFTLALNKVRSRQRRGAIEMRVTEAMSVGRSELSDSANDPFEMAQQRELRARVDVAIGELGESERETFLLYWFGGMSYAEISAVSSISIAAAKVRVHRALARLNKLLNGATV